MGLRDRMQDAGRRAGAAAAKGAGTVGAAAKSVAGNLAGGAAWAKASVDGLPMPAAPAGEPWELSVAGLVRRHRDLPKAAGKVLGMLDRFGSVRLSARSIGFDDADVKWDDVVEIRTTPALEHLTAAGLDREIERVRKLLPPLPGRKWVVRRVAEALLTLVLGTIDRVVSTRAPVPVVPTVVVYRGGFGRKKEMVAGLTTTALLARLPPIGASITATARARGIPVNGPAAEAPMDPDTLQAQRDELLPRLEKASQEDDDGEEGGADP